jgi:signal transduction histidine kinase
MFIPGMLPIWFLFAGLAGAGVFLLLDAPLRRCVAGILIPGIFIPGMLLMSCFLVSRLFRAALLFFGAAFRAAVDLAFGIFIPGMFCMS